MPIRSARALTFRALLETDRDQKYSGPVLDGLRTAPLPQKERELACFLYRGVLERKRTLDAILEPYLNTKNKPQEEAMWLLRLGLFQILYAKSVPTYTAVNETVQVAKECGWARLAGLCNGVLRNYLRTDGNRFSMPTEPAARLSIQYAFDPSLTRLLLDQLGESDTERFLAHSFRQKKLWYRVNPLKSNQDALFSSLKVNGFTPAAGPLYGSFFEESGRSLMGTPEFAEGRFYVQDLAAQAAACACGVQPGQTVLDLCAAPGTKSFTLAGEMGNRGLLYSGELHQSRIAKMEAGANRLGIQIMHPFCADATVFDPQKSRSADALLLDVPCSGLGTLAGKPEIRQKTAESIANLPQIQRSILYSSAEYVKISGILVYATCTVNQKENQDVINRFLADHPNFCKTPLPEALSFLPGAQNGEVFLLGDEADTDGFYFCKLCRNS